MGELDPEPDGGLAGLEVRAHGDQRGLLAQLHQPGRRQHGHIARAHARGRVPGRDDQLGLTADADAAPARDQR